MRYAVAYGSPARAGMNRVTEVAAAYDSGLPRTRGDEPSYHKMFLTWCRAPPHARG